LPKTRLLIPRFNPEGYLPLLEYVISVGGLLNFLKAFPVFVHDPLKGVFLVGESSTLESTMFQEVIISLVSIPRLTPER